MLPVVVLAGGLGARLRPLTGTTVPKVLVPTNGRPFIDYKLAGLAHQGVDDVVMLVGELGAHIEAHVGDGRAFGLRVSYVHDGPRLLGTGGAVVHALGTLGDAFWVTYGDTYLRFDLADAERRFAESDRLGLMTVLHNQGRWQPSNVRVEDGLVASYAKDHPDPGAEHIDYGMVALRHGAFAGREPGGAFDLGAAFQVLAGSRQLVAFDVADRFYDVGTLDALRETEDFFVTDRTWERIAPSPG